jgi:hypothetical protein
MILKVNTKSRQSEQVILVLILNKALKMKRVKQGLMLHSWEGHCQSVEELQCLYLQGQAGQEE